MSEWEIRFSRFAGERRMYYVYKDGAIDDSQELIHGFADAHVKANSQPGDTCKLTIDDVEIYKIELN